jgi:IS605 OrfB family transposase
MRKYFKHGITKVDNQIVLDPCCYTTFEHNGKAWLKVMGINRGKRITIPLNTNHTPQGMLRLILRDGKIEVHYARDVEEVCSIKAHGEKVIGIDKGYTEVFVDSEGNEHGDKLGELLTSESDFLKDKYRNRNKISAVRDAKLHKQRAIDLNNMGCKKLNARKSKHTKRVRDKIFKAAHSVVDHAKIVVCEDLTANIKGRSYGKDQNRRLSGWVKGIIAEAIESVSQRRGSTLVKVNAAYTSQIDSRYGVLLGTRKGDLFYCFDGVVLDADLNAARNILSRLYDSEIQLYTPYKDVKRILLKRTEQFKQRLGLLNQDSSCNEKSLSTESELPF